MSSPIIHRQPPDVAAHKQVIHTLFESQAAKTPDRVALQAGNRVLTYAELNRRSNQVAHALRDHGAGPEKLVGICVDRTVETVIGILGILKSGAAYVPIDPALPIETQQFIFADSQLTILLNQHNHLVGDSNVQHVLSLNEEWPQDVGGYGQTNPSRLNEPRHLAYVIYTSGSTGRPKGVQVEHRHVGRLFASTERWFGFNEHDVWTLFHSCAFDFSVWELWGALLYGGKLVVVPTDCVRSMDRFYELLVREHVTILNQTPSAFWQLLRVDERREPSELGSALRFVVFGGEPLEVQRLRPWMERHGDDHPRLINMYGITETTVHSTYRRIVAEDVERNGSPIGIPLIDLRIHLLDEQGDPVCDDEVGEIYVEGDGVARGYLNRPELNSNRFVESPFQLGQRMYRSGDLAKRLPDGDLSFVGRADNQVKIRGFRIELGEIESHLNNHPAIEQCAVVVQEFGEGKNKRLVSCVALGKGPRPSTTDLRAFLKTKLADYKLPSAFVEISEFPLTNNGKLNRAALPSWEDCTPLDMDRKSSQVLPRTSTENLISSVWSRVLGHRVATIDADFFEQGGDSLSLMNLSSELATEFGRPFPIHALVQTPTIEAHARLVEADPEVISWSPLVPLKSHGWKQPFFCVHPGGGNALCYRAVADEFDEDRPFIAIQAFGVDGQEQLGSVHAMAQAYVSAIKTVQPQGPYYLGGWSFGGLVAYEMARLLADERAPIGALAIIDAGILYSLAVVRTLFLHDDTPLFHMSSLDQSQLLPHFREPSIRAQLVPPGADDKLVANILRVFVGNCDAVSSYRPRPYSGKAVHFTASEPLVKVRVRRGPLREWSELCEGGVREVCVPGNHLTMINPPHAATLAKELAAVCDGESSP